MSAAGPHPGLLDDVRRGLGRDLDPAEVAQRVRSSAPAGGTVALLQSARSLLAEVAGAGPLEELLREPGITDVLVNGPGVVWVDRGHGVEATATVIDDEAALRRLAQRLVAACGRRLRDAGPPAGARLAPGPPG